MRQITVRVTEQQEHTLKKVATETHKGVAAYVRDLIDRELHKQSQDLTSELKPLVNQNLPDLQPEMIKLLYRVLFLNQIGLGKTYPDEYKDIFAISDAEAIKATEALIN